MAFFDVIMWSDYGGDICGQVAGTAFVVCVGSYVLLRVWRSYCIDRKIKTKQESLKKSLQLLSEQLRTEGVSSVHRDKILELSLAELQQKLQSGELTAMEVLRAYQSKAMQMNEHLNCVVEPIWEAQALATECDLESKKKGPLHGIPISLKEAFYVQGYDCTAGMLHYVDKPVQDDAVLVKVLKRQGAIPFVRTNLPQTMLGIETSNPISGLTKNPCDQTRCAGGSSGGEGALIGGGGSLLGFGDDIGGSIRIPSAFCGICGFKPTSERLSTRGIFPLGSGQTLVRDAVGPMAKEVDSLVLSMQCLTVPYMYELDPFIPVMPFRTEVYEKKTPLRVGFYTWDGCIHPTPAVARAVMVAKSALEKMGHTVVEFKPPRAREAFIEIFLKTMFGDGLHEIRKDLKYDRIDPVIRLTYYGFSLPYFIRRIISFLIHFIEPMTADVLKLKTTTVGEWWNLAQKIDEYKLEFVKSWRNKKLDAVICPALACTPVPLHKTGDVISMYF
ncbi:vitamin D3 hydroxylase-associated protein-like isoform X2 [Gigantopelta aegis]|uniref:vitamin D3 hydroxylase-associated protein-like isoform X2 n=1 Tax=Gigantopelta aegis TaxID=1735272 RepID=UPI001B88D64E|nr:vitamin D3 hydroxylase-associated protein-like isoform X2 [Gigantopelta aegis]